MDTATQQISLFLLAICSPFILAFLIVAILSPRFEALSKHKGWKVQRHPADHRDYLFKGQQNDIQWEMEYYIYDHYRKLPVRHTPFVQVIVWTTRSAGLPQNTLLIYPRRDKLRHLAHPRLTLRNIRDVGTNSTEEVKTESLLSDLPEKAVGVNEFRESFTLRTDLEVLPHNLITSLQLELSSWSKIQFVGPIIVADKNGVTIWWIPIGMRNEWLEKTVKLGTSLASFL
jgi:hypothetical protein